MSSPREVEMRLTVRFTLDEKIDHRWARRQALAAIRHAVQHMPSDAVEGASAFSVGAVPTRRGVGGEGEG